MVTDAVIFLVSAVGDLAAPGLMSSDTGNFHAGLLLSLFLAITNSPPLEKLLFLEAPWSRAQVDSVLLSFLVSYYLYL